MMPHQRTNMIYQRFVKGQCHYFCNRYVRSYIARLRSECNRLTKVYNMEYGQHFKLLFMKIKHIVVAVLAFIMGVVILITTYMVITLHTARVLMSLIRLRIGRRCLQHTGLPHWHWENHFIGCVVCNSEVNAVLFVSVDVKPGVRCCFWLKSYFWLKSEI